MKLGQHIAVLLMATFFGGEIAFGQEESLGRLFYTPEQRAALNANIRSRSETPAKPVPVPPSVSLNGVLTRSDGERTVWVDGRVYYQGKNPSDMQVITRSADPGRAELKLPGVKRRMRVRVGQRVDPASGSTFESYESPPTRRRVVAEPSKSAADSVAKPSTDESR